MIAVVAEMYSMCSDGEEMHAERMHSYRSRWRGHKKRPEKLSLIIQCSLAENPANNRVSHRR